MHKGIEQSQKDLDYGKFQYDTLVALFSYGDKNMVIYNKNRALATIDCLEEILKDTKEFIESLEIK